MTRRHICDVTGCNAPRLRRQRLCASCQRKLPGELRVGIPEAKHQRRTKAWRDMCNRAGELLGFNRPEHVPGLGAATPRVSAERSYELTQRMLGERSEP
jgi:hypothetical protein